MTKTKWLCLMAAALATVTIRAAVEPQQIVLVKDGQPRAAIVVAESATRSAQLAAAELQWHILRMTGATLPIATDKQKTEGVKILVGESDATRQLGLKGSDLKPQEYLVRFQADTLALIGNDAADTGKVVYSLDASQTWPDMWDGHGSLDAVYDFLENSCGARWFNSSETGTFLPKSKTLAVSGTETRRAPSLQMRFVIGEHNHYADYDAYNCLWRGPKYLEYEAAAFPELRRKFSNPAQYSLAKRGVNGLFLRRMRLGGEKSLCNHSMYSYFDRYWREKSNVFVEKKPELFAKGYAADTEPPQLCYTNPELVKLVARQAQDYFKNGGYTQKASNENPGPAWGRNFYAVEPMDNGSWCKCDSCRAWYEDKDRGAGDYILQFVNAVAREVAKTNPDKFINTLAYGAHINPPNSFKLEPNVVVHFCFDMNRMPYATGYQREEGILRDWAKQGQPLYLWLYDTFPEEIAKNGKWHCFPGFFAHATEEQFQLFQEAGVRGIFHCGFGQEADAYVTFKLMENDKLKVDDILDDYFGKLYGPAGAPLKEFYLEVERAYCDPKNYPAAGGQPYDGHQTKTIAWGHLGNAERMAKLGMLVEQARAAAGPDPVLKTNVDLFEKCIWSYMIAGREQYLKYLNEPIPAVTVPRVPAATGNPLKVDWSKAAPIGDKWYERGANKPASRPHSGRIAHDGTHIYLELIDQCQTAALNTAHFVSLPMMTGRSTWLSSGRNHIGSTPSGRQH